VLLQAAQNGIIFHSLNKTIPPQTKNKKTKNVSRETNAVFQIRKEPKHIDKT
jgi:hypothetical protein